MKIGIFYFSGTGNTKYIAKIISSEFQSKQHDVDLFKIEDFVLGKNEITLETMKNYDLIGIGYAVHAFNAPRNVFEFIKKNLPNGNGCKTFTFRSAGDSFGKSGSTSAVRKALQKQNYSVYYEQNFILPSNVVIKFEDSLVKQLFLYTEQIIDTMVQNILIGNSKLQKNGIFLRAFTYLFSKMESYGAKWLGKRFRILESCNLCKKCVNNCPSANILLETDANNQSKIVFQKECLLCMRCMYDCPAEAIKMKRAGIFQLKSGFSQKEHQEIINNETIKGDFLNSETRRYFKHYYKYFKKELNLKDF
jgi:flavodoxin/formate hydrogenlyase subunit 6/NADH:ubiquinone oxidoreductase subunit I